MLAAGGSVEPFWGLYQQHLKQEVRDILEPYRIGSLEGEQCGCGVESRGKGWWGGQCGCGVESRGKGWWGGQCGRGVESRGKGWALGGGAEPEACRVGSGGYGG